MASPVLMQTQYTKDQILVFFSSTQSKNKLMSELLEGKDPEERVNITWEYDKFTTVKGDIVSMIYPPNVLRVTDEGQVVFLLTMVFDNGSRVDVPIMGNRRAGGVFTKLNPLLDQEPNGTWLRLQQDDWRQGLVKWDREIKELFVREKEGDE